MRCIRVFWCLLFGLVCSMLQANAASVSAPRKLVSYGVSLPDSATVLSSGNNYIVDYLHHHPMLNTQVRVFDIQRPHLENSHTIDFYLLLLLCILLGIIRFVDPRYFINLWTAFWNPSMASRQLKEQIDDAGLPELLMNLFFAVAIGTYLFYVVGYFAPKTADGLAPTFLLLVLIGGVGLIYLAKYSAVRFSGWAFRMEAITGQYLFNVFLINKILSMLLVPFIIVMAFAEEQVARQIMYLSLLLGGLLIFNRYVRSWQLFGPFFQNSRFHFFMYLCASELLPLAVLVKFLVNGL
ncbi:MAG: DUF4271 domain-containing protein [Chitinophagia bacterium]|nr:DUF4271 domain-containing protein [Chitinophagia bacterium]